ncbi:MAG: maleylacetoacetate isomerase [Alphaproteobacteria bacterium]|nr:maleylacetoacetate isomerase [Pseudomonadota bacterium]TDI67284.1 MAG: maleylacetoacetate isomerase [Alphaproteobacteria bacterium]
MLLYDYFRSSASFRVRIGLNLKGIVTERASVHLLKDGGAQFADAFTALNPQQLVPVLEDGDATLIQSMAILEYLDETHPSPPFLPQGAAARCRVRALAQVIACDLHPLDNLRVLKYLKDQLGRTEDQRNAWYRHWVAKGLGAFEALVAGHGDTGSFCHGAAPGLADIALVPQIFNARRFDCPLDDYPTVMAIFENCMAVAAFDAAQPDNQPDAG